MATKPNDPDALSTPPTATQLPADTKPVDSAEARKKAFEDAAEKQSAAPTPSQDEADAIKEGHGGGSKEEREKRKAEREKRDKENRDRAARRRDMRPATGAVGYETR